MKKKAIPIVIPQGQSTFPHGKTMFPLRKPVKKVDLFFNYQKAYNVIPIGSTRIPIRSKIIFFDSFLLG